MNKNIKASDIIKKILWIIFILPFKVLGYILGLFGKAYNKISKRFYFSITFKTTIFYTLLFTLMLLLLSGTVITGLCAYLVKSEKLNMENDFQTISTYLKDSKVLPIDKISEISKIRNTQITLFDKNHVVLFTTLNDNSSAAFYDNTNSKYTIYQEGDYYLSLIGNETSGSDNQNNYIANYIQLAMNLNNKLNWNSEDIYIQITNKLSSQYMILAQFISALLVIDLFFIIITIVFGSLTSKRMMKPVFTMTAAAKKITISALDTRLNVKGSMDELKELSETFNNMLDRLQESYEKQNQFVSDASHELRTPIAVIQGYANMLDRWGKDDRAVLEESISAIKSESENMKDLVEKLLFLARSDKDTQKVEKENFYINELIDEVISETKLIDKSHEILSVRNEPAMINADPALIKQALRIFIDNSIKYTPEKGKIIISSMLLKRQILITIEDTGIGISKDDLPHIFDRFYRADKSRTKETGGTGLGLAIAKWIVQKHNGVINVESKLNQGTKITICLPINVQ